MLGFQTTRMACSVGLGKSQPFIVILLVSYLELKTLIYIVVLWLGFYHYQKGDIYSFLLAYALNQIESAFFSQNLQKIPKSRRNLRESNGCRYKIMQKVTCQSNNLIYALSCNICGIQYVGQTQNRIMDRFNSHLSTIRRKSDTTVARHMATHNILDDPP